MASAVACSMIDGDNIIENVNNVSTSFPNFVQISNSIGMDIDHI
jgi:5-enolpyruvylshikimate-3-phosphate synthase